MDPATPPSRTLVLGRRLLAALSVLLGAVALDRWVSGAGLVFVLAFLVHWLGLYPRWICLYCPHYGRVCSSGGGKVSALFYDRPGGAGDPLHFARRSRWGHLAGIGLRALPITVLAVAVSGPRREDLASWGLLGILLLLGFLEGRQYSRRTCPRCRALPHCRARWSRPETDAPPQ